MLVRNIFRSPGKSSYRSRLLSCSPSTLHAFVDCLAFAPDESRLIAGVRGSLLQLLEATSLNLICDRYLRGHLGMSTLSINYIACGDRMVVSIQPKHVYVLDGR
jgi:hypothetical protein